MAKVRNPKTKTGKEVTPAVADALAREAERGYDLIGARRRRPGRPSLAGKGVSPRLSFRIVPKLYLAAQEQAEEEGRSISDLMRGAVTSYLNSPAWRTYQLSLEAGETPLRQLVKGGRAYENFVPSVLRDHVESVIWQEVQTDQAGSANRLTER